VRGAKWGKVIISESLKGGIGVLWRYSEGRDEGDFKYVTK